jgi:sulfonate transport system ATP-binding protein
MRRHRVLTNKPTGVKTILDCDIPHPRDVADEKFVKLRNQVTELIRWW